MAFVDRIEQLVPNPALGRALVIALGIVAAWVLYAVVSYVVGRIARAAERSIREDGRRQRVSAVFVFADSLIKGGIIFLAAILLFDRLGVDRAKLSVALGTLIIAWIVYRVLSQIIRAAASAADARIEDEARRQRVKTLILLGDSVLRYVLIFVAALTVLAQFDVDLTPVLAGAGILGLAVGFGAQNLVRDVISGFFIILEGQYAVGDLVEINAVFGRVEWVGLRTTRLREPNGQLRYFPNGSITSANSYTENQVSYVITVPVPAEEPPDPLPLVRSILDDFEREFRVFADMPTLAVDDLPSYSRVVRVQARAIPGRHQSLEQKLPARLAAGLERAGHPMPSGTEVAVSLLFPPPGEHV
jgi:small conductance mechanosensitive channel